MNKKTKYKAVDIMCYLNRKLLGSIRWELQQRLIACLNTGEKRTQTDIVRAAGITEVTLRNGYRDIKSRELDLMPAYVVS